MGTTQTNDINTSSLVAITLLGVLLTFASVIVTAMLGAGALERQDQALAEARRQRTDQQEADKALEARMAKGGFGLAVERLTSAVTGESQDISRIEDAEYVLRAAWLSYQEYLSPEQVEFVDKTIVRPALDKWSSEAKHIKNGSKQRTKDWNNDSSNFFTEARNAVAQQ